MKIPTTPLIIAATIAIAIGPLFVGFFGPASDARWLLARAANEYQDGKPDQARKTLEKLRRRRRIFSSMPTFGNCVSR
jgi:hypothetical protein